MSHESNATGSHAEQTKHADTANAGKTTKVSERA
jgi:hypothetical protein